MRVLVPVLLVIGLAGVLAGCGSSSKTPSTPASTALPTTTEPLTTTADTTKQPAPKPIPAIPVSAAPQAKAYIAAHGADVKLVAGYEKDVQTAIAEVINSPLMSPLQVSTQKAYNKLYKILPHFKGPYKKDALGLTEQEIATQANAIEKSMNTLLNYTAYPTPVTLGEYTDQYQAAVLAWNKAVKAIWTAAKTAKPPTICTTC
ncbi:MAG TPA: hypothetical protein VG652_05955 [Gaiellaceae bacterium]|nr:hypothetical protein [Gaiellaceae bacterium]